MTTEEFFQSHLGLSGDLISEAARFYDRFNLGAADEVFYEYVGVEIASGYRNQGLFLKCFSESEGDDRKTEARYIKERVKQVKLVFQKASQELARYNRKFATVSPSRAKPQKEPKKAPEPDKVEGDKYSNMSLDEMLTKMKDVKDEMGKHGL